MPRPRNKPKTSRRKRTKGEAWSYLLNFAAIREARDAKRLSQREAATLAGWSTSAAWSIIETGNQPNINLLTLEAIGRVLGVNPKTLLHDAPPKG